MTNGFEPTGRPRTEPTPARPAISGGDAVLVPRLVALAIAGALLFVPPLLRWWEGSVLALFLVWAGLIGVLAWLMERDPG